eukprot:scaffold256196_cov51-Attheya_sp.AAC.1
MSWTESTLPNTYWRNCYSYLLCSTVGALEDTYKRREIGKQQKKQTRTQSFALTGTQETGKSVLGAFIGLVLAKAFEWQVTYHYGNTTHTFGDSSSKKRVLIWDASVGEIKPSIDSDFLLVVSSCNPKAWHDISQQGVWSTRKGNWIYIDPLSRSETENIASKNGFVHREANYELAGGVARFSGKDTQSVKEIIDTACGRFLGQGKLKESLVELDSHNDAPTDSSKGKIYPGL